MTYGEQGRIIDETDVINDIFATNTDAHDSTPNNSLEAHFPMGDSVMEHVHTTQHRLHEPIDGAPDLILKLSLGSVLESNACVG
jgi:hypothetical protein